MRLSTPAVLAAAIVCGAATASAKDAVTVGVIEGLSGPPAITDFGESYLQGLKMALKAHNAAADAKTDIKLIVYDDEANPQRAVSLATRLIQADDVAMVIGTVSSGNVMAFAPILQQAHVPLIAGPSVATNITTDFINQKPSYIFRCSMVDKYQVDQMLDYGLAHFQRIGVLASTTGYGNYAVKSVVTGLAARNAKPVDIESVAPDVSDLTPQMLKLKEAGAQYVLNFDESFELIYRPMPKVDYRPVVAGNWGLSSLKVLELVGAKAIEGTIMGQALDLGEPRAKAFDEAARKEYGAAYRWPVVVALGYDAGRIAFAAIDQAAAAGKPSDRDAIRDALENIDGFDAVTHTQAHPFTPTKHECLSPGDVFLGVWKDGQVVKLQ
jgi:branched-chain amino acid transport system substrate-binding protein